MEWTDADGVRRRITGSVSSSPPAFSVGERVTVRYVPGRPDEARIDSFLETWFVSLILGLLGTIFFSVGAGFGVHAWRKKRNREWLEHHGTRIQAKFSGVVQDMSVRVNGRHPWRLTGQWQNPSTGAVHTFQSDAIWFDPTEFVKGETLDVLVNPDRPSMQHVDTGFLPPHAG